jgi:hypothetical protein
MAHQRTPSPHTAADSYRFFVWGNNSNAQLGLGPSAPSFVAAFVENPFFSARFLASFSFSTQGAAIMFQNDTTVMWGVDVFNLTNSPSPLVYTPTLVPNARFLTFSPNSDATLYLVQNSNFCPPGTVSQTGLSPCANCTPGTFQSGAGRTLCALCAPGQSSAAGATSCGGRRLWLNFLTL